MTTAKLALPDASRGGLLRRVLVYGATRGTAEGLLALRGILLAAVLGPAAFGSWALVRLAMRYAALGGLGITRGLEFELLHPVPARGGDTRSPAGVALGFMLAVAGALAALALVASVVVSSAETRLLLRGFAAASVAESAYTYALVATRVRKSLRHYAGLETGTAALHLAASLGLAGLALPAATPVSRSPEPRRARGRRPLGGVEALVPDVMLSRLLRLGVPVAVTGMVGTLLLTADRWVVAGWGGATMLGYYAFGGSVATAATAVAVVIRTVVFADVYGESRSAGSAAAVRAHLECVVLPFARLLPPLLGALAIAVGPLVAATMRATRRPWPRRACSFSAVRRWGW